MGYRTTGFVTVSRALRMMEAARAIAKRFHTTLDRDISKAIKSLAKSDTIRLSNFNFERLLTLEHPAFDDDHALRTQFIELLAGFLKETGYIDVEPNRFDYNTDPLMPLPQVIDAIMAARMPKFTSESMAGEFATLDTLASWFPEVIRRIIIIENERPMMIDRFHRWIGHLGYKLLRGESLAQHELTAFAAYNSRRLGTPGYYPGVSEAPITPVETTDPLVMEIAALYKAVTLPGPFTGHQKVKSDCVRERLMFWMGLHISELKMLRGTERPYGPFKIYDFTQTESMSWTLEGQLRALTAVSSQFGGTRVNNAPFSVAIPQFFKREQMMPTPGMVGCIPDDPSLRLILVDQSDCSKFDMEFKSTMRQGWINSRAHSGTLEMAITEAAFAKSEFGAVHTELATLADLGLCTLTNAAQDKIIEHSDGAVTCPFLLPDATGRLEEVNVDITPLHVLAGSIEARPAYSEFYEAPLNEFWTPAPKIVEYVAAVTGMTLAERDRYSHIIALYYNCNVYKRLTGKEAPIDKVRLSKAHLFPYNPSSK